MKVKAPLPRRRRLWLAVLAVGALAALAGLVPVAQPVAAVGSATPGLPIQRPSGVPYNVSATPITNVTDGQAVKINVASDPSFPVYGIQVQLCRTGVTYEGNTYQAISPDFREGGSNCPAKQISSNGDHLVVDPGQAVGNAMEPGGETVTFHVGQGSTSWTNDSEGGRTESLTCDVGAPCALVVEVLAGIDADTRWEPWVFKIDYQDSNPLNSCGGPAAGILRTAASDRMIDAYIGWTVDLCKRPGQQGALTSTSFPGEADAMKAYTAGTADIAYSALGYNTTANLLPPDLSKPNGGHRPSVVIPLALNATVVAVGNGEIAKGKKVPYQDLKMTTPELAGLFGQGQYGITPYINDIQARNPAMLTILSGAFGRMAAASAESQATSWFASRYFSRLAPAQWVVGGLGDLRPLWGQARSIDASFALADPTFAGVVNTLSDVRGGVRKTLIGQSQDDTGGAWVLTDLATARALDLTPVQLTNSQGAFVGATSASMTAAANAMIPDPDGIMLPDPAMNIAEAAAGGSVDATGGQPYPLTFVEYAIVPAEPLLELDCTPRAGSQQHLTDWLTYLTGDGQQNLPAGMEPLPPALLETAKANLAKVGASASTQTCPPSGSDPGAGTGGGSSTFSDGVSGSFGGSSSGSFSDGSSSFSSSGSGLGSSFSGSGAGSGSSGGGGAGAKAGGSPPASLAPTVPAAALLPGFGGNRAASALVAVLALIVIVGLVSGAVVLSSGGPMPWSRDPSAPPPGEGPA